MELQSEQPQVMQLNGQWVVRVERPNGKIQEYRCASEEQARQLVTVFAPSNSLN